MRNMILILVLVAVYFALRSLWIPGLNFSGAFFVDWFVVFLHEFGHALAAVLTGGHVTQLVLFPDEPGVAGYACTAGGVRPVVQMGGYVGSALFGAFFLVAALSGTRWVRYGFWVIAGMLVFSVLAWFPAGRCGDHVAGLRDTVVSVAACGLGAVLMVLANRLPLKMRRLLFTFLGVASLAQIVLDINVGPSSDLVGFQQSLAAVGLGLVPLVVWKALWLALVLGIVALALRQAWRLDHRRPGPG